MRDRKILTWVALLYAAQGLPYGVVHKIWPIYYRAQGVSLRDIGLMSLLALPWSWKPLWAPLVDRFGTRRAWILPALGLLATMCFLMPFLPADHVPPLVVGALLVFTLSSATQDIAIDAWVVDIAGDRDRDLGWINGVRASAFRVAVIAAGGAALLVAGQAGWQTAWGVVAGIFLLLGIGALALPEPERVLTKSGERPRARELVRSFLRWVFRKEMLPIVLFALLFKLGDQAIARMTETFWVDRGMSLEEIALVSNTLGILLTISGALTGGWIISRIGLFWSLLWIGLGQLASNLVYSAVAGFDLPRESIYFASAFENFTQGLGVAALLSFLTACCRRENAATEYALLSALFAFSRELAGALSGFGAESMGYAGFFAFTAALAIPALALLPWLRRPIETGKLRAEESAT